MKTFFVLIVVVCLASDFCNASKKAKKKSGRKKKEKNEVRRLQTKWQAKHLQEENGKKECKHNKFERRRLSRKQKRGEQTILKRKNTNQNKREILILIEKRKRERQYLKMR